MYGQTCHKTVYLSILTYFCFSDSICTIKISPVIYLSNYSKSKRILSGRRSHKHFRGIVHQNQDAVKNISGTPQSDKWSLTPIISQYKPFGPIWRTCLVLLDLVLLHHQMIAWHYETMHKCHEMFSSCHQLSSHVLSAPPISRATTHESLQTFMVKRNTTLQNVNNCGLPAPD